MPMPFGQRIGESLEQRETDRRQAALTTKTRLGYPHQATDRATNVWSCAV